MVGVQEHYIRHAGYFSSVHHISTFSFSPFTSFFTDVQIVATLIIPTFFCTVWNVCVDGTGGHWREPSARMMHGRLLSDTLIFLPSPDILLCSPLTVLWLSSCDKLMAPGVTTACWESQQHACSLHGSLDPYQRAIQFSLNVLFFHFNEACVQFLRLGREGHDISFHCCSYFFYFFFM